MKTKLPLITRNWLAEHNACEEGKEFYCGEGLTDPIKGIKNLLKKGHFAWATWLLVRLMTHKQKVQFAVFAAEQVLPLYQKRFPDDARPYTAINAAKVFIKTGSLEGVYKAADAAANAANAANAADAADAANAAYAAANAANAADAAANAANAADAANAAAKARSEAEKKIVYYGIKLITGKVK